MKLLLTPSEQNPDSPVNSAKRLAFFCKCSLLNALDFLNFSFEHFVVYRDNISACCYFSASSLPVGLTGEFEIPFTWIIVCSESPLFGSLCTFYCPI